MLPLRFEIVVNRPIDQVFAYVTDIRNSQEWFHGMQRVEVRSIVDHGVGTEYEYVASLLGWRSTTYMAVTEYTPPARMTVLSTASATPFTALFVFEPIDGGRATRFILDAQVVGTSVYRFLGRWFGPMLCRVVGKSLNSLRDILDGRRAPIS